MAVDTRMNWYEDLEKQLICFGGCQQKCKGPIFVCGSGHNICYDCHSSGHNCNFCGSQNTNMRNYLTEGLAKLVGEMKLALSSIGYVNKPQNVETASSSEAEAETKIQVKTDCAIPWGSFPCRIGSLCNMSLPFCDILEHFKVTHPLQFEEYRNARLPMVWDMVYRPSNRYDRAFLIANVGLFSLHIEVNDSGDLKAVVAMYQNGKTSIKYSYKLEITCGDETISFNRVATCARMPLSELFGRGFSITKNKPILLAMKQARFKCLVTIEKRSSVAQQEKISLQTAKSQHSKYGLRDLRDEARGGSENLLSASQQKAIEQYEAKKNMQIPKLRDPLNPQQLKNARARIRQREKKKSNAEIKKDNVAIGGHSNNPSTSKESEPQAGSSSNVDFLVNSLMNVDDETLKKLRMGLAKIEMDRLEKKSSSKD